MKIYQFIGSAMSYVDLTFAIVKPDDNYMSEFFRANKIKITEYDNSILYGYKVVYEED